MNLVTTSGLVLYEIAATRVPEDLTSTLLINDLTNRFTLSQLLRPILPDESTIKAISRTGRHSLSVLKVSKLIVSSNDSKVATTDPKKVRKKKQKNDKCAAIGQGEFHSVS